MRARPLLLALLLGGCRGKATPITSDPAAAPSVAPTLVMADSSARVTAEKPVRVLASGQNQPWGLFVTEDAVWWTNKGRAKDAGEVARVMKSGGPHALIASGLDAPYGIAIVDGWLAVGMSRATSGGYLVKRLGQAASVPSTVALAGHEPWSVTIHSGSLLFTDLSARAIEQVELVKGGAPTVLAKTAGRPVGLALDDTHAYFTDSEPGVVAKVPLAGGAVVELVKGGDKTTGIAVDATHVYWSEWGSGRIATVPKNGGAITVLATGHKGARAITIDGERLYFTHPPSGSIRSVAKSGGPVTLHATGQKHPYSIAVDAKAIYWADVDAGTICAVDK